MKLRTLMTMLSLAIASTGVSACAVDAAPPAHTHAALTRTSPTGTLEDARRLVSAYRDALSDRRVASAASAVLTGQIAANRPLGAIEGHWLVPLDMRAVYNHPDVRPALVDRLGKEFGAGALPDHPFASVGLAIIGDQVYGEIASDLARLDRYRDLAFDALTSKLDTAWPVWTGYVVGDLLAEGAHYLWDYFTEEPEPTSIDDPRADPDGDGLRNEIDGDDDGDHVEDRKDRYPYDPSSSICDQCSGYGGTRPPRLAGFWATGTVDLERMSLVAWSAFTVGQALPLDGPR
jgi:hypothetical protein